MIFVVKVFRMSSVRLLKKKSVKKMKRRNVQNQKLFVTLLKLKSALLNMNRSAKLFIKNAAPQSMNWSALQSIQRRANHPTGEMSSKPPTGRKVLEMKIRTARQFLSITVEMLPSPTADRLRMSNAERFLTENVDGCQSKSADRSKEAAEK